MNKVLTKSLIFLIFLTGCGVPKLPDEDKPAAPVLQSISYKKDGVVVTLSDSLTYFNNVVPDFGNGNCAETKSEFVFRGTVDSVTKSLELIGADDPETIISNGNFEIKVCVKIGSATYRISSLSETKVKSDSAINFSLTVAGTIMTLGFGHPKYPAPGFVVGSVSQKNVVKTGDIELNAVAIGSTHAKEIQSTGNTDLSMRVGFVSAVRENNLSTEN